MFKDFPLFPDRASTVAGDVDLLYLTLVAISVFFAVLISTLVVYFAVRYRRRSEHERPEAIHGSIALEMVWTIIPFMIAMGVFAWGASIFYTIQRPPAGAMEMYGVGKQWM